MSAELFSHVQLFATPWTVACQAPLTMGILQARILEWVAISSSRRSSWPRDGTCVSCVGRWILYHCDTWEAILSCIWLYCSVCVCILRWAFQNHQIQPACSGHLKLLPPSPDYTCTRLFLFSQHCLTHLPPHLLPVQPPRALSVSFRHSLRMSIIRINTSIEGSHVPRIVQDLSHTSLLFCPHANSVWGTLATSSSSCDGKTEAQWGWATCSGSHTQLVQVPGSRTRWIAEPWLWSTLPVASLGDQCSAAWASRQA